MQLQNVRNHKLVSPKNAYCNSVQRSITHIKETDCEIVRGTIVQKPGEGGLESPTLNLKP